MPPLPPILSLGDAVTPGAYSLLAAHRRSRVYATPSRRRLLFAVDPSIGPGPLNVVLADPHALPDALRLSPLPRAPLYRSAVPLPLPPRRLARLRDLLQAGLPALAPPDSLVSLLFPRPAPTSFQRNRDAFLAPALPPLARALSAPRAPLPPTLDAIRRFRGCGTGMTPSGDDFLSGLFLAYSLVRARPVPAAWLRAALSANPVSNAFLRLAAAARVHAPLAALLARPAPSALPPVLAFGHTSGADTLSGLLFALSSLLPP